jgi:serine protease Do
MDAQHGFIRPDGERFAKGGLDRVTHANTCCKGFMALTVTLMSGLAATEQPAAAAAEDAAKQRLLAGKPPRDLDDLQLMQASIQAIAPRILGSTVAVRAGVEYGSGVIVSKGGFVLTAAHVARYPGRNVEIILSDGRVVPGAALGMDRRLDAGLFRILQPGPWPHATMASKSVPQPGQWCLAAGHPGGYEEDREAVLRWGRVISTDNAVIQTDGPLEGGDSGGPLFDLSGRVIGIHSRIGLEVSINLHVPAKWYVDNWSQLAAGQIIGDEPAEQHPFIGVTRDPNEARAKLREVRPDSPAARAGLAAGDIILKFDVDKVHDFPQLMHLVSSRQPGDVVALKVLRQGQTSNLKIEIGGVTDGQ